MKYIGNMKIVQPRSRLHNTNFPDWTEFTYIVKCLLWLSAATLCESFAKVKTVYLKFTLCAAVAALEKISDHIYIQV